MAPRDLALSRPSPRGKKNSRGAPRLRQIERANSSLSQVRHDVIERVRTVAVQRALVNVWQSPASKRPSLPRQWRARHSPQTQAMVMKPDFHYVRAQ